MLPQDLIPSLRTLRITAPAWTDLLSALRDHHPDEACGLLAGRCIRSEIQVLAVRPLRNRSAEPGRSFDLDPLSVLAAPPSGSAGWVGIFHSHPAGPAEPSAADLRDAWPGTAQLILAPGGRRPGAAAVRATAYLLQGPDRLLHRLRVRFDRASQPDPAQNRSV